jgi:Pvc16 N-terminal domain
VYGLASGARPARATLAGVIAEVDDAVRALVRGDALAGTDVEVVFDAPTKDWAVRRNAPTVNLYLYDIREDMHRRERGLVNEYDERGFVVSRHMPPRHFRLSYLVTAWTQRPEDEHRLLSALLSCFIRHDSIPDELLSGPLRLGLPVAVTVALPPPEDRSFADVWSALGGELKPSLDLVISAPIDTGQHYPAGPPVEQPPTVELADRNGGPGAPPARSRRQGRPAVRPESAAGLAGGQAGARRRGLPKRPGPPR